MFTIFFYQHIYRMGLAGEFISRIVINYSDNYSSDKKAMFCLRVILEAHR